MTNARNFFLTLAIVLFVSEAAFAANVTQIGRYSTVLNRATAAQINPLLAVGQFRFPASVKTVGEAIQVVLENTGYQLAPRVQLTDSVKSTLGKTLPITVRRLGPLSIKTALSVLMGEQVFNLVEDPLHRIVNFEIKPAIAKALGVRHDYRHKKLV